MVCAFFFLLTQMLRLTYKVSAAGMITAANETERASKMSGQAKGLLPHRMTWVQPPELTWQRERIHSQRSL